MSTGKKKGKPGLSPMNNVFNGSSVLLGVCLTVISLFQIMDKRADYIIDEIFGLLSFLFALAALLAYLSVRKDTKAPLKKAADSVFIVAVVLMIAAGMALVMEM